MNLKQTPLKSVCTQTERKGLTLQVDTYLILLQKFQDLKKFTCIRTVLKWRPASSFCRLQTYFKLFKLMSTILDL